MSRAILLLIVLSVSGATDAARAAQECRPQAAGVRAVRAVAAGIVAADNERALDRVLGYYTADAVLMPPGESPLSGREKIRVRYEALFAAFTPEIHAGIEEACVAGGLGFVRGHNGGRLVGRESGAVRQLDDAYLMLLRLEADGVWRISHLMWHRQSPPDATSLRE